MRGVVGKGVMGDPAAMRVVCGECQVGMDYHPPTRPGARDYYWECPYCGADRYGDKLFPAPGVTMRQIRSAFHGQRIKGAKGKGSGGSKGGKGRKKPGKILPWYQRVWRD